MFQLSSSLLVLIMLPMILSLGPTIMLMNNYTFFAIIDHKSGSIVLNLTKEVFEKQLS